MAKPVSGPAIRYAKALFELALEDKNVDLIRQDLVAVVDVVKSSAVLSSALNNPIISSGEKGAVVASIASSLKVSKMLKDFIAVLGMHGRSNLIVDVAICFEQLVAISQGEVVADVFTAVALTDGQRKDIESFVKTKREDAKLVKFNEQIDPSLLGGVKLRIGSVEYDMTIRGKLSRMKSAITAN